MRLRNETKVGLIVFAAFVGIVAVYWFLGGYGLRARSYPIYAIFPNAQKLDKGADVRMAGVKIGVVKEVRLTEMSEARIEMLIWNGTEIPIDSGARITTGAFIGDSYVEIVPGSKREVLKPGQRIATVDVVQFDQLIADAGALLKELRVSARSINNLLGDEQMIASIKETVKSLQSSADSASQLMGSVRGLVAATTPEVQRVFDNLAIASDNAVRVSLSIQDVIEQDARPNVQLLMARAREATENLNASVIEARNLIQSFNANSEKIGTTLDKVDATAEQAKQTMTNLNVASESIKELATDEQLKQDLRTTLRNAAEASEEAKGLVGNLSRRWGGTRRGPTPEQKAAIPDYGISGNALWNTGQGSARFDGNYTFALPEDAFLRLGLYDIGEDTKVNLQGGKVLDRLNALRYGLYASRLGIGYDRRITSNFRIAADIFRPDEPELELRGIFQIQGPLGIYAGVSDLFGNNDRDLLLGVHYQK